MESHARAEAQSLLALLARGASVESIRQTIAPGSECDESSRHYRTAVMREFDALVLRLDVNALRSGRIRLLQVARTKQPSPMLQAEIVKRLLSETNEQVAHDLRVSLSIVRRLARKHKTSFRKPGRGRRYSQATIQAMTAELKAGARPTDVSARYGCTMELTKRIRNELGDTLDRRDLRLIKPEIHQRVKQALATKKSLSEIEREFSLTHSWLWHFRKHILHDKEDRRRRRPIPETERQQIAAELKAGKAIRKVARLFHYDCVPVREIGIAAGWAPHKYHRFTSRERTLILKLIAAGKRNREIASALQCKITAIQTARRKCQWITQAKTKAAA